MTEKVQQEIFTADLLVLGGGMAGLTAAAHAAEAGKMVLVVERQSEIGGSAVLSGGGLWTARDYDLLRQINPLGQEDRARALCNGYDRACDFMVRLQADITEKMVYEGTQSFPGWVRHLNVTDYFNRAKVAVTAAGGWIVTNAHASSLIFHEGRVRGAEIESAEGVVAVHANHVLIATGGFQNSAELRTKYLPGNGAALVTRSNPASDGAGIRLGLSAGAGLSEHMGGWYGHTIPYPLSLPLDPHDYIPLAQFFLSPRSVLLEPRGMRFVDESRGYYLNAQAVAQLPRGRAIIIFDDELRVLDTERYGVDRWDFARRKGAQVAVGDSLDELESRIMPWGFSGLNEAITAYNHALEHELPIEPERTAHRSKVTKPPFYAMHIQPAITFTHGGLRTDAASQVLNDKEKPIPGLLAAGADAGATYHQAYAGGLAMAAVFGMIASETALRESG
jgi:succinate dehydrogenase/fumarate reductase flavoprotein subunit